ncbi:MAG: Meiotic Sister-Chromatid recombination aldehyde dehydrogenase [Alyxoria varia]|nr:MAG: Meiotic Sister-Chromatid recombination aldehyde dehydrogenase [Alyxoria varia]
MFLDQDSARGAVEWLKDFPAQELFTSRVLIAVAVILFTGALYYAFESDPEAAVSIDVSVPEVCRDGFDLGQLQTLDEPSIQIPGSTAIQCYAPATGKFLGRVNPITPEGIDRAIAKARDAQVEWAKTSFADRRKVLKTILKYILANTDAIVRAACLDSGKTKIDATFGEVLVTAEKLRWTINHMEEVLRPDRRDTNWLMLFKNNEVRYEPLGVVAALVSWNYPFHNLFNPIISTLATGNALLLKPSERTAFSVPYFTSIARAALSACGHSPNLIQPVVCWPTAASHLTSHPAVEHITFIGSREVAHQVAYSAAKSLTPCTMELGGKDPAIVLDNLPDSDLKRVSSILMRGVFQAAGQNCIGIERVIATPHVYDRLLSLIEPRVRALRTGCDLHDSHERIHVGACISAARFTHLEALIADAVKQGARLLIGGRRIQHPRWPCGHYFAPTLLVDVTPEMRIAREELFAPVFVMMRARDTWDAVEVANAAGGYGLGASVFARHGSEEVEVVVRGVRAGMCAVNDFASYYVCNLPFGGVGGGGGGGGGSAAVSGRTNDAAPTGNTAEKQTPGGSGYGRFSGPEGLRALCNVKAVCKDGWFGLFKTGIPGPLDYPWSDGEAGGGGGDSGGSNSGDGGDGSGGSDSVADGGDGGHAGYTSGGTNTASKTLTEGDTEKERPYTFIKNVVHMLYAPGLGGKIRGVAGVLGC